MHSKKQIPQTTHASLRAISTFHNEHSSLQSVRHISKNKASDSSKQKRPTHLILVVERFPTIGIVACALSLSHSSADKLTNCENDSTEALYLNRPILKRHWFKSSCRRKESKELVSSIGKSTQREFGRYRFGPCTNFFTFSTSA